MTAPTIDLHPACMFEYPEHPGISLHGHLSPTTTPTNNRTMPNWCDNQLTVTSATPELRAYLKDNGFSFEKIKPQETPEHPANGRGELDRRLLPSSPGQAG